jgi:cellobiose phosphorylase
VQVTGDRAVLDELVPFLAERVLGVGEEDLFSAPASTEQGATLYEHCVRALQAGTTSGPHGLPTMRGGDWNDGMNHVGHEGRGESIWLAWFLARTLQDFAPLALARGDRERASWCGREVSRLGRAIEQHGWDGDWYRRAYFDDGTPIGSRQNEECSIDAIAQSWAVISGIADPDRAARALRASEERLVREADRLICLLSPPFQHTVPDPGYIQAYPPGIRENGGQYTHGVLWTVVALAQLGEGDRAYRLLSLLNPITHADHPELTRRYRVEPYVVAADIYASPEHPGRGGWTWYTGSAGWFYRAIVESVLGVRRRGQSLELSPCIPSSWPGFELAYRTGATTYRIRVSNPERVSTGVLRVEVDGKLAADGRIQLADDGASHEVLIVLGQAEHARSIRQRPMGRLGS